ncbi:MAG: glycosyltransferase [Armatimonadetes bacterium]|nr:MAG: glycosyltransferase [Armatimonadota bacterium]
MKPNQNNNKAKLIKTNQPLVSIIMPVYNTANFLVEAIESIINQTYQNFELIIINDASTDNSLEIIKKYQKKFSKKIKVIDLKNNLNRGGDSCANQGIKIAQGKYIARMDADDVAHPKRFEKQISFLEKNPDIFLVGSNAYVINKRGKIIGEKIEPQKNEEIYKNYLTFHPLIHPSCTLRRQLKTHNFCYEIKYSANNDYYTFFKLICLGYKFTNLPEKLLYYRIHNNNDTFINIREKFFNTIRIRLKIIKTYGYQPTPKDILISFIQTLTTFFLPEKVSAKLYLVSKGIIKPKDLPRFFFLSLKKYVI